jgi:Flp pilus assembly protein TadD
LLNPDYAEAHWGLGTALVDAGQLQEATTQFEQALQLKADYPAAHTNLGIVLFRIGRRAEAIEHVRQALLLNPSDDDARHNLDRALAMQREAANAAGTASEDRTPR